MRPLVSMLGGRSNTTLYLWASSINLRGRRKKEEGRRKKEEGRRKKEEGRRKKGNAVRAIFSAIKNVLTFLPVTIN
ncbi:hypothetical protein QUA71_07275 [Microcoleus sp. MON1_C5]|uniref:hypothetical protein n=1 Tax=Microcoleus sp. MON1_C5 TaxID=2818828 RepID=UPI002FD6C3B3